MPVAPIFLFHCERLLMGKQIGYRQEHSILQNGLSVKMNLSSEFRLVDPKSDNTIRNQRPIVINAVTAYARNECVLPNITTERKKHISQSKTSKTSKYQRWCGSLPQNAVKHCMCSKSFSSGINAIYMSRIEVGSKFSVERKTTSKGPMHKFLNEMVK